LVSSENEETGKVTERIRRAMNVRRVK